MILQPKIALTVIILVTFFAFFPALSNGWTSWDDGLYVVDNKIVQELSWKNLQTIWTTPFAGTYLPLTMLSYAVEYSFAQFDARIYHTTNVLLHCFNTALVFWLILQLQSDVVVAFVCALLFGIHPMHVESVAWISGRKDVLSSLFFLSSLVVYLRFRTAETTARYLASLLFFFCALLSKGLTLVLPLVLLLFDWYGKEKNIRKLLYEKIPFILLAVVFGVVAVVSQKAGHALRLHNTVLDNLLIASHGIIFYFAKLVAPIHLQNLYPYPQKINNILPIEYLVSPVLVVGIVALFMYSMKYTKAIIFGGLFFFITLFPVLQLLPMGSAVAADRYTYLSYIGLFFIVGMGMKNIFVRRGEQSMLLKRTLLMLALLYGSVLFFLTQEQCAVWKNNETLWKYLKTNSELQHQGSYKN